MMEPTILVRKMLVIFELMRFIDPTLDAHKYLETLIIHLASSAMKIVFISDNNPQFKLYQDNDPKYK